MTSTAPIQAFEDPMFAILNGFKDPSSIFIKDEPHPRRKVVDGRYRCITPVSLVDQVIESILFTEQSEAMKVNLYESGSAVGIGFSDEQIKQLVEHVAKLVGKFGSVTTDDVSGFDGLHTLQLLIATYIADRLRFSAQQSDRWWIAQFRWVYMTAYSVVVLGCVLYSKIDPGMIDSGSRDTSRRNTTLRTIYGWLLLLMINIEVGKVLPNGDDCITAGISDEKLPLYEEAAQRVGIKLRDVMWSETEFNFCSHAYSINTPCKAPLTSWHKAMYKVLTADKLNFFDMSQVLHEVRHNDVAPSVRAWFESLEALG
jgi:hypothetical protein